MGILSLGKPKTVIGLDIGSDTFRVAQVQGSKESPLLVNCGSIRVPRGAVVGGEIVDVEVVSYSLNELWRKTGLGEKKVVIGVANQKVVVRLVDLPYMEKAELKSALQFQAQDYIPIPVEDVILDYQVVSDYTAETGERMIQVLLVAAQKDMIQSIVTAVEGSGLIPEVIDVSAFAITRSLIPPEKEFPSLDEEPKTKETIALLNVGAGITTMVVVEGGITKFARVIALAGDDWTESLTDGLGITFDEAEDLKVRVALPPLVGDRFIDVPSELLDRAEVVQDILEKEIMRFIGEIKRSFDYFLAQSPNAIIDKALLSGGASKLKNLDLYFEKGLQLDVKYGHPLEQVGISPKLSEEALKEDEPSLSISVGLAMGGLS